MNVGAYEMNKYFARVSTSNCRLNKYHATFTDLQYLKIDMGKYSFYPGHIAVSYKFGIM